MAIERMDESCSNSTAGAPDAFGAGMLVLWQRKGWIIGVSLLATVACYGSLRAFFREEFKATGQVYSTRFNATDDARYPDTVATIATSHHLLDKVRVAFMHRYSVTKPPAIEDWVKQFKTKTEVIQDTAIKKEYSPIIELSVQAGGREETRFLLETWQRMLIEDQGNYATEEARIRLNATQVTFAKINADAHRAESEQATASADLAWLEKQFAELMNRLAPANLVRPLLPPTQSINDAASNPNGNTYSLRFDHTVQNNNGELAVGLISQVRDAKLKLALAQAQNEPGEVVKQQTLIGLLETEIAETSASIVSLQAQVANAAKRVSSATREVEEARGRMREIHIFADRIEAIASTHFIGESGGLPAAGDIRILAGPVVPDLRAWPKRTIISVGVGAATGAFYSLWLLLATWLNGLLALSARRKSS